jgi:hypothetical protein
VATDEGGVPLNNLPSMGYKGFDSIPEDFEKHGKSFYRFHSQMGGFGKIAENRWDIMFYSHRLRRYCMRRNTYVGKKHDATKSFEWNGLNRKCTPMDKESVWVDRDGNTTPAWHPNRKVRT